MSPVPEDVHLPSGWVCKRVHESELVLRHEAEGFEVVATRTDDSDLLPFEITTGWELTCRLRAGESVSERALGRVSTRTAAIEGLQSCMERVSTLAQTTTSGLSLGGIARDVKRQGDIRTMPYNPPASS